MGSREKGVDKKNDRWIGYKLHIEADVEKRGKLGARARARARVKGICRDSFFFCKGTTHIHTHTRRIFLCLWLRSFFLILYPHLLKKKQRWLNRESESKPGSVKNFEVQQEFFCLSFMDEKKSRKREEFSD